LELRDHVLDRGVRITLGPLIKPLHCRARRATIRRLAAGGCRPSSGPACREPQQTADPSNEHSCRTLHDLLLELVPHLFASGRADSHLHGVGLTFFETNRQLTGVSTPHESHAYAA